MVIGEFPPGATEEEKEDILKLTVGIISRRLSIEFTALGLFVMDLSRHLGSIKAAREWACKESNIPPSIVDVCLIYLDVRIEEEPSTWDLVLGAGFTQKDVSDLKDYVKALSNGRPDRNS